MDLDQLATDLIKTICEMASLGYPLTIIKADVKLSIKHYIETVDLSPTQMELFNESNKSTSRKA